MICMANIVVALDEISEREDTGEFVFCMYGERSTLGMTRTVRTANQRL